MGWEEDIAAWEKRVIAAEKRAESNALKRIKDLMLKLIEGEFDTQRDPYGSKWKRKNQYPWPILNKSGALKSSFKGYDYKAGVEIESTSPYFKYQNPVRKMIPGSDKIPADWMRMFEQIFKEELEREMKNV